MCKEAFARRPTKVSEKEKKEKENLVTTRGLGKDPNAQSVDKKEEPRKHLQKNIHLFRFYS